MQPCRAVFPVWHSLTLQRLSLPVPPAGLRHASHLQVKEGRGRTATLVGMSRLALSQQVRQAAAVQAPMMWRCLRFSNGPRRGGGPNRSHSSSSKGKQCQLCGGTSHASASMACRPTTDDQQSTLPSSDSAVQLCLAASMKEIMVTASGGRLEWGEIRMRGQDRALVRSIALGKCRW
jgi:hypothetical protein